MAETKVQVNVMMEESLAAKLDEMVLEDYADRSKVIRKMIAQEYERRNMPTSIKEAAERLPVAK